MNNGTYIPILAFADDIAIFAKSNQEIQDIFKVVENFCDHSSMSISTSKSAYTYNNTINNNTPIYKGKEIEKIKNTETYCYLGIDIAAMLEWKKQRDILEERLKNHVNFLRYRKITTQQKITILNIITNSKIAYRMSVINFPEEWIRMLDDMAASMILNSGGMPKTADKELLWTRIEEGGRYNTLKILTEKIKKISLAILDTNKIPMKVDNLENNEITEIFKILCKGSNIKYLDDLFWANGHIKTKGEIKATAGVNEYIYNKIKDQITNNEGKIKNEYKTENKKDIFKDNTTPIKGKTEDFYIYKEKVYVFTDGSKLNKRAGAGVFFCKESKRNHCFRIVGEQTSLAGELFAVEYTLNNIPMDMNAIIVTDNKTVINYIQNFEKLDQNRKNKIKHRSIVTRILEIIEERKLIGISTELDHVYSHIKQKTTKSKDKNKWKEKVELRKKEVGYMWNMYVYGNEEADKLAAKGTEMFYITEEIPIGTDNFAIIKKGYILENNLLRDIKRKQTKKHRKARDKKEKRGRGWREEEVDKKLSAEISNILDYKEGELLDFIHKHRQLLGHNRKEMFRRGKGKENKYSAYMRKVYDNEKCILCEGNHIDDREHYRVCKFSENHWDLIYKRIEVIMNEYKVKKYALWFGKEGEIDENAPEGELIIANFDRCLGNRFFIPMGIKEYFKYLGIGKKWKEVLEKVMKAAIEGIYTIQRKELRNTVGYYVQKERGGN